MQVLFYVEPLVERENPVWKKGWVEHFVKEISTALVAEGVSESSIACLVPTALGGVARSVLPNSRVVSIDQTELIPRFGSSALEVASRWYLNQVSPASLTGMSDLVRERLGNFTPTMCVTFSPAPFLKLAWPQASVLHMECGFISRPPYPETVYFDPRGMFAESVLAKYKDDLVSYSPPEESETLLADLRQKFQASKDILENPVARIVSQSVEPFESAVLLALQFSNFYAYNANARFQDQYDLLVHTLESLPRTVAVVVCEHPEHQVLRQETVEYLTGRYPNFIWHPLFRQVYGVSHYLMPFVQGVITVSSSVGLQALLWRRHLAVVGEGHLAAIADTRDVSELHKLLNASWDDGRDRLLCWLLSNQHLPFGYLVNSGRLSRYLQSLDNEMPAAIEMARLSAGLTLDDIRAAYETAWKDRPVSPYGMAFSTDPNNFVASLYVATEGRGYDEVHSIREFVSFSDGAEASLSFRLEGANASPVALRFDPANRPCSIALGPMRLADGNGNTLWTWCGEASGVRNCLGLELVPQADKVLAVCYDDDPQFELAIDFSLLASTTKPLVLSVNILQATLKETLEVKENARAELIKSVAEKVTQIANLSQAVTERDGQIANLSQVVTKRDGQIANLSQAVTERDGQIANLSQVVTERDGQIANMSQVVTERNGQIASQSQAATERDGQIASLNQSVEKCDEQIIHLHQAVDDARRELGQVFRSKSWQITKPFRLARRVFISKPYKAARRVVSDHSRVLWRGLPLSHKQKLLVKGSIFKTFPLVFRWSKAYQAWQAFNAPIFSPSVSNVTAKAPNKSVNEYVPLIKSTPPISKSAKLICFYLPQFHPIPENDMWWGNGFTEWTNVQPAQPQFDYHYQPHIPGELGYYSLLDAAAQRRQVELAKLYGIGGFCFYFYWFGGKRLLETPIENYLNDCTLDLPFCLCWANENWSRRWDGLDSEILMAQQHSADDDLAFIQHVACYMRDPRYIRIDGKPLLLVYRPSLLPSAKQTALRWREWCRTNGLGEIFLAYTQSFEAVNPANYGFDAAIEFPPNNSAPPDITDKVAPTSKEFGGTVYDWTVFVERSEHYKKSDYTLFRSVCPSWDNTARRKNRSTVFLNSTPALYQRWLENAIRDTQANRPNPDERLIFVNAWNEWAEGAHLEPDARYGYAYLNASLRALLACSGIGDCANVTEKTASRHQSLVDRHWNRVSALFVEAPERLLFEYLGDYVALLAQASQHGASFFLEDRMPCCEVNGEKIALKSRDSLARLGTAFKNKGTFCFVILQYNKVELTEQCVASLRKLDQCGRDVHIVIVDNKSGDEARARTQEAFGSAPDVTVLYSDANLGFSGGNNLGYEYAREKLSAEFMVILNNDTVIEQGDFIRETIDLYGRWGFSIAGPDIVTPDGRHENPWNDYIYGIEEWETLRSIRRQERAHYLEHEEATFRKIGKATPDSEVLLNPILQGAAYIVSPVFISDRNKIFDERLFLYGEEFLLAVDCLLLGHLTIYTNKLEVRHHEGASTGDLPNHDKVMHGYGSGIMAVSLTLKRLERHREASLGSAIDFADIENISDYFDPGVPNVLVDLLFCQPGYHGGGEYGKAVFKALAESKIKHGGFQLWVALNPNLFIDSWVWETCKENAINIVTVRSYDEIARIVNSDSFDSFFTPAIVVYTGYEYMGKVGSNLPFNCKKTRVIGTLHDIRDFELAFNRRQVLETRRKIGCLNESKMSGFEINHDTQASLNKADSLRRMYQAIVQDETVDTIVTISSYCENSIKNNIGSPRKSLRVLASPQKPRPTPQPFVSDKFNPNTSRYALLVHAAREEKNGASAVVAFDKLFEESNNRGLWGDFLVVLTGVTHLDQLGLSQIRHPDRFIALSELAPGQFEYLLKHARFLVYPSFNEGFGYPPIEAMTYGVPSAVSKVTAIPEVCGQAVKYFDPHNLESIKEAIWDIWNDGVKENVIFEQYSLITEKQNADLEILVGLIVGNNRFGREAGSVNSNVIMVEA